MIAAFMSLLGIGILLVAMFLETDPGEQWLLILLGNLWVIGACFVHVVIRIGRK